MEFKKNGKNLEAFHRRQEYEPKKGLIKKKKKKKNTKKNKTQKQKNNKKKNIYEHEYSDRVHGYNNNIK